MKICSKCKIEKEFSEFYKDKGKKFGIRHICKECERKRYRSKSLPIRYDNNGQPLKQCCGCKIEKSISNFHKQKHGKFDVNGRCKECKNKWKREIYYKNPEVIKHRQKPEIINRDRNYRKNYYIKHREILIKNQTRYEVNRRKNDALFKLKCNLRGRLYHAFKNILSIKKTAHTFDMVGISPQELKIYIENKFTKGMTWENYGRDGWEIDHIIPLSLAKTESELIKLCYYKNLQPLWEKENGVKGNRIL